MESLVIMGTLRVIRENSEMIIYNKWFWKPHQTFPKIPQDCSKAFIKKKNPNKYYGTNNRPVCPVLSMDLWVHLHTFILKYSFNAQVTGYIENQMRCVQLVAFLNSWKEINSDTAEK